MKLTSSRISSHDYLNVTSPVGFIKKPLGMPSAFRQHLLTPPSDPYGTGCVPFTAQPKNLGLLYEVFRHVADFSKTTGTRIVVSSGCASWFSYFSSAQQGVHPLDPQETFDG